MPQTGSVSTHPDRAVSRTRPGGRRRTRSRRAEPSPARRRAPRPRRRSSSPSRVRRNATPSPAARPRRRAGPSRPSAYSGSKNDWYSPAASSCGSPGSPRSTRSSATGRIRATTPAIRGPSSSHDHSSSSSSRSCARIGPASRSGAIRWRVTPIAVSPFRTAQATGIGPRCRGRSDGWKLTIPSGGTASASGGIFQGNPAQSARSGSSMRSKRRHPVARRRHEHVKPLRRGHDVPARVEAVPGRGPHAEEPDRLVAERLQAVRVALDCLRDLGDQGDAHHAPGQHQHPPGLRRRARGRSRRSPGRAGTSGRAARAARAGRRARGRAGPASATAGSSEPYIVPVRNFSRRLNSAGVEVEPLARWPGGRRSRRCRPLRVHRSASADVSGLPTTSNA